MTQQQIKSAQIDPDGAVDGTYGLVVAGGVITGLGEVEAGGGGGGGAALVPSSTAVGSGSGDYTASTTSYADVNAALSTTIAAVAGDVLVATFTCSMYTAGSAGFAEVGINIGGTVRRANGITLGSAAAAVTVQVRYEVQSADISSGLVTVKAQWKRAASSMAMINDTTERKPTLVVINTTASGGGGNASAGGGVWRVKRAAAGQSITHNTSTALQWDTGDGISSAAYDSGNNTRWVAPITGYYMIVFSLGFTAANGGVMGADFGKNGALKSLLVPGSTTAPPVFVYAEMFQMTAGDYITAQAYQNSGSARTVDTTKTFITGLLMSPNGIETFAGSIEGVLAVATGAQRIYNDTGRTLTITAVRGQLLTAPTGSSVILDVHKNGTTIFTTQSNRPTFAAASQFTGKVTTMDVTAWADGEYLTVDIDQVGSTVAGSDLQVLITAVG